MPEQMLTDQMGRFTKLPAKTKIHARLAKIDRIDLRVAIGKVQKVNIAKARQVVEPVSSGLRRGRVGAKRHTARGSDCQYLKKLPTTDRHGAVYPKNPVTG